MSYTEELTQEIVDEYLADQTRETVDKISSRIGKSPRSVIAKLSSEGAYKSKPRTTKTGDPIVKKEDLVKEIGEWFGIEVPTLVKTSKLELIALYYKIKELVNDNEARSIP
jgi:hypothetical protein